MPQSSKDFVNLPGRTCVSNKWKLRAEFFLKKFLSVAIFRYVEHELNSRKDKMDPEYQEQHLQFVATNNNGSTITDIIVAGAAAYSYIHPPGGENYGRILSRKLLKLA
jgi:hypothetical protein